MSNNKRHYQSVALFIVIVIFISSILYNFSSIRSSWQHLSSGDNNSVATLSVDDGWYRSTDDAYQYPISPYTTPDIWKTYTTVMQKWEAIQIPTDILHSMSTAGLIESCINCPFYAYYINFMDNYYTGIKIVEDQFNGLQELYKREDAAIEFVKFYQTVNVEKLYNQHEIGRASCRERV